METLSFNFCKDSEFIVWNYLSGSPTNNCIVSHVKNLCAPVCDLFFQRAGTAWCTHWAAHLTPGVRSCKELHELNGDFWDISICSSGCSYILCAEKNLIFLNQEVHWLPVHETICDSSFMLSSTEESCTFIWVLLSEQQNCSPHFEQPAGTNVPPPSACPILHDKSTMCVILVLWSVNLFVARSVFYSPVTVGSKFASEFMQYSCYSLWYIYLYIFSNISHLGTYHGNGKCHIQYTEWPKKIYTLFTHQYLWNKFKWNFYFRVRV